MSKEVKVEVGKSIDSAANRFEARLEEESNAHAMIASGSSGVEKTD